MFQHRFLKLDLNLNLSLILVTMRASKRIFE